MKLIWHGICWLLTILLSLLSFLFLPGTAGYFSLLLIALIIPLEEWQALWGKYIHWSIKPLIAAAVAALLFFALPSLPVSQPSLPAGSSGVVTGESMKDPLSVTGGTAISSPDGSAIDSDGAHTGVSGTPTLSGDLVWIPIHGGIKYHTNASCSDMIDPIQVPLSSAVSQGFDPCKKCYN